MSLRVKVEHSRIMLNLSFPSRNGSNKKQLILLIFRFHVQQYDLLYFGLGDHNEAWGYLLVLIINGWCNTLAEAEIKISFSKKK